MWTMYRCTAVLLLTVIIIQVAEQQELCYHVYSSRNAYYCDSLTYCCYSNTRCCDLFSTRTSPLKRGVVCEETSTTVYYCTVGYYCCGFRQCCPERNSSGRDISETGLSGGAIAGIVLGSIFGFIVLIVICCVVCSKCQKSSTHVTPIHVQQYHGRDVVGRY